MINNLSYFILLYIVIILTLNKLNIDFIDKNYIIIDNLKEIINMTNIFGENMKNIIDKYSYLSNKFNIIFILRFLINIYIGYNRDKKIFIYNYIIIYLKNIIIEIILILGNIESNIIINPIIMTIGDIIGKLFNNNIIYNIDNNSDNHIKYD